jgi:LmbE family N-acetylglucosaminyl deacetylase
MAMELVVDDMHPGTDERTWLDSEQLRTLPSLGITVPQRLVVVAPHPDDEVLGAAGLLQCVRRLGVELAIVTVTDGEGSHPVARANGVDIASTRAMESTVALDRLGCGSVPVTRLGFPDGAVATEAPRLTTALTDLLRPDDLCVTPWRHDGHPDHNATGAATLAAAGATRTSVLQYLVWTWHWAAPDNPAVPWHKCRRLNLGRRTLARKRWATHAFRSQIRAADGESRRGPVLTDSVLRRFWRPFEVFIEAGG